MGFRFSLEAVLLLRREREAAAERALAAAERDLATVWGQLRAVRDGLQRMAVERAGVGSRVLQGVAVHEQYARWAVLDGARVELEQRVAEMELRRDARRLTYLAARRDRDLLEGMEAEQRAGFAAAAAVREQKRADELFLMRRLRR